MAKRIRLSGNNKPRVSLSPTGMFINGCQLLIGHPDPVHSRSTAVQFKVHLSDVMSRAGRVTLCDYYNANMAIYRKLELGESLWN